MKTSALSPKKHSESYRKRMTASFAVACLVYVPLVVWALIGIPNMAFKAAGQEATVSLSFAQISGGSPAAATEPQPQEMEPEPEPEPEKEEAKPEPEEEPAIVKKEPPKKKVVEPKPKPKKERPKKREKPKDVAKPQAKPAEQAPPEQAPAQQSLTPSATPTATQGAPTAGSQGGISTLVYGQVEDPFLAEVKRQVEAALHYPRKARAMRMQGVATVQFIVAKDGTLTELEIYSSSGHGLLDKMAVKAVVAAQPNWGAPNKTVRLRFPIQFRLSN